MGIKGLMVLLSDHAPVSITEHPLKSYFGRVLALDASIAIYQFLSAVRFGPEGELLTNEEGETTSHLKGFFNRTSRLLAAGVKPIYIFDGEAPRQKLGEQMKRRERKEMAEQKLEEAKEAGKGERNG